MPRSTPVGTKDPILGAPTAKRIEEGNKLHEGRIKIEGGHSPSGIRTNGKETGSLGEPTCYETGLRNGIMKQAKRQTKGPKGPARQDSKMKSRPQHQSNEPERRGKNCTQADWR